MAEKSSFMGKKSSFKLFGKIEFPSKRTKKACVASLAFAPSSQEDRGTAKILTYHISSKLADIIHCALRPFPEVICHFLVDRR